MLWVDEKHRNKGLGTQLLLKAEVLAGKRGCKYVHLDTFSFQAPEFYRKLGYKRFGALKPFPKGSTRYFLYKKIKQRVAS
jgi:ribosomal protein S18 acetylase RimI-like enzyme